jgi:hypothetical protein
MKKFLNKLFLFISIPTTLLLIAIAIIGYIANHLDFKINSNINEIYIGDSHVQCAINDSFLTNSKNVSRGAESFYFSYFKLKKIIEHNKQIKKVYLGASYHSFSNYYDAFISGEFSPSIAPKYFYVLPLNEKINMIRWNLNNLPQFIELLNEESQRYLFKNNTYNYGDYSNKFKKTKAAVVSMDKRLNFQYYTNNQLNNFSEINLEYFSKIIELCGSNNIELVLLNTPIHPYFKKKIPPAYINKFNIVVQNKKLDVIDFNNLNFTDSSFIPDGDHVSVMETYNLAKEIERLNQKK